MAGLKKDVELIFRGEDRASPTIKGVRSNVRDLTKAIDEQMAAAERGEGTIDDLAKVYKRLKEAQGDVGEITKLAAAYDSLVAKHAEQSAKAADAAAAEAKLTAEVAAAATPTKRLQNQRDAAARSAAAAAQKETELAAQVKLAGEAFEAAGGDIRQFEASQEAIRATALETARALRTAGDALDNYGAAAQKGVAAQKAIADAGKFDTLAAGSGLPEAQIRFISGLENRIEALSLAMRENAASAAAMNREIADRENANAAQRIRDRAAAYDEAARAAERLEAATTFKNQAASVEAGARDISRFGAAADTATTSARRLADTIQAISAPAAGAARSLDGINGIVDRSEALFDGTKRRMSEYNNSLNDLAAAQAGMAEIARNVDHFRAQEAAVAAARQEMEQAQASVLQLATAIQQAENPTEQMANELVRAEAALERTGDAVTRETAKLRQLEAVLESAAIDTKNLATAEVALEAAATRAAAAQQRLRGVSQGRGGFLGLNPNELQNLGYQVNDIVVSIASGQNPLTVFIQQGAQIGQIWPGAFSKIAARIPAIAAALPLLVSLGAAMGEAAEDARRLSEATASLSSMGEVASNLDTETVALLAERLEEVGLSAKDANASMRELMAEGLNGAQIEQYIETAKAAADATGVDFKDALEQVRESFSGGYEDIVNLDAATNAFTDSEMALIEQLYNQGDADIARATALEIYNNRMNESAANANGPWKSAITNLGIAWNQFIDWLSNTAPIRLAGEAIEALGRQAAYWSARLAGKSAGEADAVSRGSNIKPRHTVLPDPDRTTAAGKKLLENQLLELEAASATTAAAKRSLEVRKALNAAIAQGLTTREAEQSAALAGSIFDAQEAQRQEKRDIAAGKRADAAARRREAQRKREARAAAAEARKIEQMEEQLRRQLEQLDAAVGKKQEDDLERRLDAIDSQYAKLFRDIDEYAAKTGGRGMIGDRTIEQARAHVEAQERQLKNYETLEFRETQLQNLLSERSEKLDAIDDRVARGIISPEEGLQEADAVINDIATRVTEMATSAVAFAEALRGAVPSPQLDAFIAKMNTAIQNNSGGQNVRESRDRRKDAIDTAESGLNDIIARRNQLLEHENLLVEMGLQSRSQARANIEGHYNRTSELIRTQIQNVRALAEAFANDADPAMRLFYDNLIAKLEAADLQASYLDPRFTELKSSMDQLITSNIVGFIDSVSQAFANLAMGQGDVMDFFESIGLAFLDMISKTLLGIAQLIIQMIVLDAVEKLTGIPVMELIKFTNNISGVFHDGGLAGQAGGRSRQVSPLAFSNAPRYHSGGIAGFAPDEVGAVLRKNEEVLTTDDPRHRFNGGLSGGGAPAAATPLTINNLIDAGEFVSKGADTPAGKKALMNFIKANKSTISTLVNG